MLNLLLAILSSSLVALVMRWSERHGKDRVAMLAMNYVACTALAACFTPFGGAPMQGTTLGLGVVNGLLYLGSFLMLQWCVSRSGVILSSTFMKLGVLVPTIMSVVIFGETPKAAQVIGFALTIAAIVMMNLSGERGGHMTGLGGLILLLLAGGVTDGMSKVYETVGDTAQSGVFLLLTFGVALIACTVLMFARKQRPTRHDLLDGLLIGIPNYFSARFLLASLSEVPAVVAYPTFSVATIAVVSLVAIFAFRERLKARQWAALTVIAAALILLNV